MIELAQETGSYLSNFAALEPARAPWLETLRRKAIARFAELGFPTTRDEEWQYTNVAPVAHNPFRPAPREAAPEVRERVKALTFRDLECTELVFVDGRFAPDLSARGPLPGGVWLGSLASALEDQPGRLEPYLGQVAPYRDHAFVALNTAFIEDGAFLYVPRATALSAPIHLVFASSSAAETASHPRNLIVLEPGSQASIVETHAGPDGAVYFANSVTEIVAGERSVLAYCKLDQEGAKAFHFSTVQVRQEAGSSFKSHAITFGGALVRNDLNVTLAGDGAECSLNGLYLASGRQHVDNHTTIDHARPHGTSRELYKGILDGHASAVFNGRIIVRRDAQKTVARQTNKNLLMSEDAVVNTKPQLEINADDVKCNHGATIGQLDPAVLFYLRSRGIGNLQARNLLINAFGSEIIEGIAVKPLHCRLDLAVVTRLSRGQRGEEVVV
jgi:Fe-S cluster assembly protein SufD